MSENIYLPIHSEEQWRSKSTKARAMLSNYKAKQMLNTQDHLTTKAPLQPNRQDVLLINRCPGEGNNYATPAKEADRLVEVPTAHFGSLRSSVDESNEKNIHREPLSEKNILGTQYPNRISSPLRKIEFATPAYVPNRLPISPTPGISQVKLYRREAIQGQVGNSFRAELNQHPGHPGPSLPNSEQKSFLGNSPSHHKTQSYGGCQKCQESSRGRTSNEPNLLNQFLQNGQFNSPQAKCSITKEQVGVSQGASQEKNLSLRDKSPIDVKKFKNVTIASPESLPNSNNYKGKSDSTSTRNVSPFVSDDKATPREVDKPSLLYTRINQALSQNARRAQGIEIPTTKAFDGGIAQCDTKTPQQPAALENNHLSSRRPVFKYNGVTLKTDSSYQFSPEKNDKNDQAEEKSLKPSSPQSNLMLLSPQGNNVGTLWQSVKSPSGLSNNGEYKPIARRTTERKNRMIERSPIGSKTKENKSVDYSSTASQSIQISESINFGPRNVPKIRASNTMIEKQLQMIQRMLILHKQSQEAADDAQEKTSPNNWKEVNTVTTEESMIYQYVIDEETGQGKYTGEKLQGKMHGKGVFSYKEGYKYDGEWKEGEMSGQGVLYFPDGRIMYEGEWEKGKFHGKGILHNRNPAIDEEIFDGLNFEHLGNRWVRYEGTFIEGRKNGTGSIILTNGCRFDGNFSNDVVRGQGSYTRADGSVIVGCWKNNKLLKQI